MNDTICPTCGSQCSLGGVGNTHYFIPLDDENERIADLERQLAETCLEVDKKISVIRYYEDTLCCPMSTEISLDHGVKAKEISPVKIKELLEAYEAVRKKAHDACKILTLSMARGLKDEKRPTWKEFCIAFEALDAICDEKPNE